MSGDRHNYMSAVLGIYAMNTYIAIGTAVAVEA